MKSYTSRSDIEVYIAQHLEDARLQAAELADKYGGNFESFFYQPAFDLFIRKEVLPLLANGPGTWLGYVDIEAPDNILYDGYTQEYIFRQPKNYVELVCVLDAAAVEVFDSYSSNGNDHWTYQLCKEWWGERFSLIEKLKDPDVEKVNGFSRVRLYLDYLNTAAEMDLRRYCYFLNNGRPPEAGDLLPGL